MQYKRIRKKLKSDAGESISEVLVALLISSLALVMLASMISTTQRIVSTSKEKMNQYYEANQVLDTMSESGGDLDMAISGGAAVNGSTGTTSLNFSESVSCYTNDTLGKNVYAYSAAAESEEETGP